MTKKLITVKEAARILGVPEATVWDYIRMEYLTVVSLACGDYRLWRAEIQKLLSRHNRKKFPFPSGQCDNKGG